MDVGEVVVILGVMGVGIIIGFAIGFLYSKAYRNK